MTKKILDTLTLFGCLCALLPAKADDATDIPLYFNGIYGAIVNYSLAADGPGSSTIDPVDPNLAKAELTGNTLVVQENVEGVVAIDVINTGNGHSILSTSFDNMLTLQLVDTATYVIRLTFENRQKVYGLFCYPLNIGQKEISNGKLYIRFSGKRYALPGTTVQ